MLLFVIASLAADLRIAVAPFENASTVAGHEALGLGLQSMLTTDLTAADGVDVLERARISDVLAELELAGGGAVDPTTAAKVGKLLGATHFVTGSVVVAEGRMRLDARMFDASTGQSILATSVEGERDAFFELEKDLVRQLLTTVEVTLTPRERHAVGKVHTSDYRAFEDFSRGIEMYDAERFNDAVASLRAATVRDSEFTLAVTTLASYETLIANLDHQASVAAVSAAEARWLEDQQTRSAQMELAAELETLLKDEADPQRRLAILYILHRGFMGAWKGGDRFATRRRADLYARMFWHEARPHWPKWSPVLGDLGVSVVGEPSGMIQGVEGIRERMFEVNLPGTTTKWGGFPRQWNTHTAQMSWDARTSALAYETLLREAYGTPEANDANRFGKWKNAAKELRGVLELDRSTALLEELAATSTDAARIREISREVEKNRRWAKALESSDSEQREWLLYKAMSGGTPGPFSAEQQKQSRRLGQWILWDGVTARPRERFERRFASGPRTDRRRTSEIVYTSDQADASATLLVGDTLMDDASFSSSWVWAEAERPTIRVLLGLRDVATTDVPMTGHALEITANGAARWLRIGESTVVLATFSVPSARSNTFQIEALDGDLRATVNGREQVLSWEPEPGFMGIEALGAGSVTFSKPDLHSLRRP